MPTYLTDDAVCLRVTDFSETSQIVGLFTRRHGVVPLIAKGAKRQSKKNTMSGPLDLLTAGEVVFILPREQAGYAAASAANGTQLGTLAAWELADHRGILRASLGGLNAGMVCAELTTHLLHPHDPHDALFDDLQAALTLLAAPGQRARTAVAYAKAALVAAGYWPQWTHCLACDRPTADAPMRFSSRAGGVLCGHGQGCHVDNAGPTHAVPGRLAVALDRLPLPSALLAQPPERPADEGALQTAMGLLLSHVEALTDKAMRTRFLLPSIFAAR
jgi:DNA repair protein RecO